MFFNSALQHGRYGCKPWGFILDLQTKKEMSPVATIAFG